MDVTLSFSKDTWADDIDLGVMLFLDAKAMGVEEFPAGDYENEEIRGPTWNPEKQQHFKSAQGQEGSLRGG